MRLDMLVSVIAPLQNDGPHLREFVTDVIDVLQKHYANYELILVDDCSTDGTIDIIDELMNDFRHLRLIRLSRSFGTDLAIGAGLDASIGDYVVVIRAQSDPPGEIPGMICAAEGKCGVILGTSDRKADRRFLVRLGRSAFFWLIRHVLPSTPPVDATGFCVLSRRVVNAINQIKSKHRHLGFLSCAVGYSAIQYSYQPVARSSGRTSRPLREAIEAAISILITNSFFPLRVVSVVGAFAAALNLMYVLYIVLVNIVKQRVAEGWTTLSLQISVMFLFVFLNFIIISEYMARMIHESRDGPYYHVLDERVSSARIHDPERRNVV